MFDLLRSPFKSTFEEFANSIISDCFICSPYITFGPIRTLVQAISEKKLGSDVPINILTDISLRTVVQGATEIPALLYLFDNHPNVSITYLPRIHAKVYIANKSSAIVTSANFTDGGEIRNFEYGVKINNNSAVQKIQNDINGYRNLGANINQIQLVEIQKQVENVRSAIRAEQKAISRKIRLEAKKQERIVEDNLIRIRIKGKSTNSIFSETLLYLLSMRPMETEELHLRIKNIHPDLCDDNLDRVIDGRHFGKLWKHQVRNAQAYLKRAGLVQYDEEGTVMVQVRQIEIPIICENEQCPNFGKEINVVSEITEEYLDLFYENYDGSVSEDYCSICGKLGVAEDPIYLNL